MYIIIKLLYLIKWVSYSYSSYTILRPVHFHLVSGFSIGSSVLHASATWKTQARRFSLSREEKRKKYLELITLVHQVFLVLIDGFPFWPDPSEKVSYAIIMGTGGGHSLGRPRPIHRQAKRLSSHARTGSAKCDGVPFCVKCTAS